jgi:hypothetical protein
MRVENRAQTEETPTNKLSRSLFLPIWNTQTAIDYEDGSRLLILAETSGEPLAMKNKSSPLSE